jgi:putative phage-type endonuclease
MENRTEWLAERRKGLGGSDVAALLGLDPYLTPVGLWMDKRGLTDPTEETDAMARGNYLEDAVLDRYLAELPDNVVSVHKQVALVAGEDGWRRGNMDARVVHGPADPFLKRCVEIKTLSRSSWRHGWGAPGSDEVPDRTMCQAQWYASMDDSDDIHVVACVIPDNPDRVLGRSAEKVVAMSEIHVYPIARNAQLEAALINRAQTWWQRHIIGGKPPQATDASDVMRLYPTTVSGEVVTVDQELRLYMEDYALATKLKRDAEKRCRELRDTILVRAKAAEAIVDTDGVPLLTCKSQERASYTVKASTSRVLRFSKRWKELYQQEKNDE